MDLLVAGDRNYSDYNRVLVVLFGITQSDGHPWASNISGSDVTLHQGACRGADQQAEWAGRQLKFQTQSYPADWKQFGRAAGPIRNKRMLEVLQKSERKTLILVFHPDLSQSKGTANLIRQAKKICPVTSIYHIWGDPKREEYGKL